MCCSPPARAGAATASAAPAAVPIEFPGGAPVLTPDDLMDGRVPAGEVLLYDDDNYYMGPVLALLLARQGARVRYVTSAARAGEWSKYTGEQDRTQRQMLEAGVEIRCNETLGTFDGHAATLHCVYTGSAAARAGDRPGAGDLARTR